MIEVQPVREIIVYALFEGRSYWFVSEKELWILDYIKFCRAFEDGEMDFSARFDLPVLDQDTFATFKGLMEEDAVTTVQLRELLLGKLPFNSWWDVWHLFPALMVDFDQKRLDHIFPEGLHFEQFLPDGWEGYFNDFFGRIPLEDRYWVIDGIDGAAGVLGRF